MGVVTASREYLKLLVQLVFDCYERFAILSPIAFLSVDNLHRLGRAVDDIEEDLGFPRGWTAIPGIPEEERLALLRRDMPDTVIDRLFVKYPGKVRTVADAT